MPKLEYFLVAESVSIDSDRNQVSVFNILEEVSIPNSGPKVVPQLVALASWIITPEDEGKDFQVSIELVGPRPDCPFNSKFSLNFTARCKRQRTQMYLALMPIEQVGDTLFYLKLNGKREASHVLTVLPSNKENS